MMRDNYKMPLKNKKKKTKTIKQYYVSGYDRQSDKQSYKWIIFIFPKTNYATNSLNNHQLLASLVNKNKIQTKIHAEACLFCFILFLFFFVSLDIMN